MKTVMQELIDWSYENDKPDCAIEAYDVIKKAKDLLEKEKEQIIEAHADGSEDLNFNGEITERGLKNAEYYYNQTYNQNK